MHYTSTHKAIFLSRPNRFIAEAELNGQTHTCHIKNTGRCKELLIPGVKVILSQAENPARVTKYDLIAVWKGPRLVNIDSQAPNHAFKAYLETGKYISGITHIKPEAKHGTSRFDFYVEAGNRRIFIEVKGVTLEKDNIALFPDAPTLRGVRHINELAECIQEGYEAHVVFVIQMKGIAHFEPNNEIHPEFGAALVRAQAAGVRICAFDCDVTPGSLCIRSPVPIET